MAAVGPRPQVRSALCQQEVGAALLAVLILLLVVTGSSTSFIWFMNQQQTRAGTRYRATAAIAAAEAGVHRALSILESVGPDGRSPGRTWRPEAYSETFTAGPLEGRFTLSLTDDEGGAVIVTGTGQVGGVTRRLRARVYLASPTLLAALNGASVVRLEEPPAATIILSYEAGSDDRPWVHVAAGREIWFTTTGVSINDPSGAFAIGPGPQDALGGALTDARNRRPGPVRLLLARDAEVTLGEGHQRVDVQQLRMMGVYLEGGVLRAEALPGLPEVDRAFFQAQASRNLRNATLNEIAGKYLADHDLALKRDSLYSRSEFEKVQMYLQTRPKPPAFQGVIYVGGGLSLIDGRRLQIVDGALITDGSVHLGFGASLEVTHSPSTRTLPGIIVLDTGTLVVEHGARLNVHGLVYINRIVDIEEGARVDIVGALIGNDPGLSFRNHAATVVIRYDPAVLGTPGLRVPDGARVVAWAAAWEELP